MTLIEALKISKKVKCKIPIGELEIDFSEKLPDEPTKVYYDELMATDWEPIIEKKTKEVWQWRFKENGQWRIDPILMNDKEAKHYFCDDYECEKHAGPWEVSNAN